jgi:hypothetical protein
MEELAIASNLVAASFPPVRCLYLVPRKKARPAPLKQIDPAGFGS